jgi:HAD superfamily hydrolase (TIGR01509 family)
MIHKAIIFDFFGVINTDTGTVWVGTVWVKKNIPSEEIQLKLRAMFPQVDIGALPESEFFDTASKIVHRTPEQVRSEWFELSSLNPDVLALITKLKEKYKIALCTNAPSALVRDILEMMGISNLFDELFISSELKMIKPSPEIFHHVLNTLGVEAHEAIFIDDSYSNVQGAKEVGIEALQFTDARELERKLNLLTV